MSSSIVSFRIDRPAHFLCTHIAYSNAMQHVLSRCARLRMHSLELLMTTSLNKAATACFPLRNRHTPRTPIAIAMGSIQEGLGLLVRDISEEKYDQSFACYRLWSEITQTYSQNHPDGVFDSICNSRASSAIDPASGKLIHPTAHLILRFASDAESDGTLAPQSVGLRSRLCARTLQDFFEKNMALVQYLQIGVTFYADVNFVAHLANLGYVEEATIHNHILQSLISHPRLRFHQANALIILFKLAGPTFAKYADPAVVDRCFELLEGYPLCNPNGGTNGLILVRGVPRSKILPSG